MIDIFGIEKPNNYICHSKKRARSSGVEHLPFKQRVGGSKPPALTYLFYHFLSGIFLMEPLKSNPKRILQLKLLINIDL